MVFSDFITNNETSLAAKVGQEIIKLQIKYKESIHTTAKALNPAEDVFPKSYFSIEKRTIFCVRGNNVILYYIQSNKSKFSLIVIVVQGEME